MELTVTNRSRAYPGRSSGDSKVDDVQYVVLKVCYLCTSGSVVEYRLAKARVAGSNPVSCFLIITRVKHLSFALFSNHYIILSKRDTESTLNWNGGLKWL